MTHIDTEEKAKAVINSVNKFWAQGRTLDEFISEGKQEGENIGLKKGRHEGRQEGEQEGQIITLVKTILKMKIKGFSAQEISNILEVEIYFVNYVIAKK